MRFKIDWASPIGGGKFPVFALFYFVFEGNFPSTSPPGAYIWRGDLTEGFLRYRFGGLIFGGAYTWKGLFSEFYGMLTNLRSSESKITYTMLAIFTYIVFQCKETIHQYFGGEVKHKGLILPAQLIMEIFHSKKIKKLTFEVHDLPLTTKYEICPDHIIPVAQKQPTFCDATVPLVSPRNDF